MSNQGHRLQGHRIKLQREHLGLTQDELGEKVGTNGKQVIRWEKESHDPSSQVVGALVEALNTNADYLLGFTTDSSPRVNEATLSLIEKLALFLRRNDRLGAIKLIADQENDDWVKQLPSGQEKT